MIIGSNNIFIERLTSTNTYAGDLLKRVRAAEGTIIRTGYQDGGRGQRGNKWESEADKNLLFSIILYPEMVEPVDQFIISKALSLAVTDFLEDFVTDVSIKWPNDIFVNNDKIAGILIECNLMNNSIESCIAGIGLNINQTLFRGGAPNPVSLALLTGREYDLNDTMTELAARLNSRYMQLMAGEKRVIDACYLGKLYRINKLCEYRHNSVVFKGMITAVTDSGLLKIEDKHGKVSDYAFKEIEFIL